MKNNALHLYRALLRETTYLFDPAARHFHWHHIRHAFQSQNEKLKAQHGIEDILLSKAASQQLHRGRKYLYMLQRANQGYLVAVSKVLQLTYGIKGARRRQLMQNFMVPATPVAEAIQSSHESMSSRKWRPPAAFEALMKNQARIQRFHAGNFQMKLEFPEKNSHAQPFPACRIKNTARKWYARQAQMLKPPLQETEHAEICRKAAGQDETLGVRKRRPLSRAVESNGSHWPKPVADIDISVMISTSRHVVQPQQSRLAKAVMGNPHRLTSRFLRRRYRMEILQSSPTVLADSKTQRLAFGWSAGMKHKSTPSATSKSQQLNLF